MGSEQAESMQHSSMYGRINERFSELRSNCMVAETIVTKRESKRGPLNPCFESTLLILRMRLLMLTNFDSSHSSRNDVICRERL